MTVFEESVHSRLSYPQLFSSDSSSYGQIFPHLEINFFDFVKILISWGKVTAICVSE